MTVSHGLIEYLKDVLAPLGAIRVRRMFGGASVYADDTIFALVDNDIVYLKADETTKHLFEAEGLGQFTYAGQSGPVTMSYWRAPERMLDDPDEFLEWSRRALRVARRSTKAAKTKPIRSRKIVGVDDPGVDNQRRGTKLPRRP